MIYNCYTEKDSTTTLVYSVAGKIKKESVLFKPSLYFKSKNGDFKNILGDRLKRKIYSNIWQYRSALYKLKELKEEYYGDIDPKYQYISHRFLNKDIKIDKDIKAYNYDIEAFKLNSDEFMKPEQAKGPVQSITIQEMHTNKYYIFGYKDYEVTDITTNNEKSYTIKKEQISYIKCNSEVQLLRKFIKFLKQKDVQVLTGYNILRYDNQYIMNRLKRLGIEDDFVNECEEKHEGIFFGKMQNLDYYVLYKKFYLGDLPSYSLDNVSKLELGFGKIEMEDGFRGTYKNDYKKFIDYNCVDVMLPYLLEKKLKYFNLIFSMSNRFRCLPIDILSITKYWDTYLYYYNLKQNVIVDKSKKIHKLQYMGGYNKEPIKGVQKWCTLYDIESSYPTNTRKHNISPETIVDYKDLPKELFDLSLKFLFNALKRTYDKNKNLYVSRTGSVSKILDSTKISIDKTSIMYIKSSEDEQLINKLAFPRFIMIRHDSLIDYKKISLMKKIDSNKYVYFAMSKEELIDLLSNKAKDYTSVNFINHTLFYSTLVSDFSEDPYLFKHFTRLLVKHKLIVTPILQFYKKNKKGIIPDTQGLVFKDRKIAKNLAFNYNIVSKICKSFLKNKLSADKKEFYSIGISYLDTDIKKNMMTILKTRDADKIKQLKDSSLESSINYNIENLALKLAINGAYGAVANPTFRYADFRLSESVTSCGQLCARGAARYLENHNLAKWIYMDTDSIFLKLPNLDLTKSDDEIYKEFNKELVENVEVKIKEYYNLITELMNSKEDIEIKMEREVIVKNALFTAKKKYHWWIYEKDNTIYNNSFETKTKGLDTIKSSTPKWVSNALDIFLKYVITGKDEDYLRSYIRYVTKKFKSLTFTDIAKSSSTGKFKSYKSPEESGLLPHYRGSFYYNNFLKKYDKEKKYEYIVEGTKVKWCWLKKSDKFQNVNVVALPEDYNKEILNFIEIDYDKQLDSVFNGMVEQVLNSLGLPLIKKKRIL